MFYNVNGHMVWYSYCCGFDTWEVDGCAVYLSLSGLAKACGVSVEELKVAIDY